jgi:hypothetical protein
VVPGTDETLRVNGTAGITVDPVVPARLAARGEQAILAVRIAVERCFFHCAKAFRRSRLWDSATWPPAERISFGALVGRKLGWTPDAVEQVDRLVDEDFGPISDPGPVRALACGDPAWRYIRDSIPDR